MFTVKKFFNKLFITTEGLHRFSTELKTVHRTQVRWDSRTGKINRLQAEWFSGVTDFSLLQNIWTSSRSHTASTSMSTKASFHRSKLGRADHSPLPKIGVGTYISNSSYAFTKHTGTSLPSSLHRTPSMLLYILNKSLDYVSEKFNHSHVGTGILKIITSGTHAVFACIATCFGWMVRGL